MTDTGPPRLGPNGRPVRHFVMPGSLGGRLRVWRFIIYRRLVQVGLLVLFFGTAHWGWNVFGRPLLQGNLSASEVLGIIPMADPFAVLQITLGGVVLNPEVWLGAAIVLGAYGLIGGRTWCAWVCPINMVTDGAAWLRRRLGVSDIFHVSRNLRYSVLVLSLVLSVLMGVAAFEWISPIAILHRELLYGIGMGWVAVLGILLFDLLVLRHGWCGHLCPLGAFYALVGRVALVRVAFDTPTCTHCGDCARVCPEPQVLNLRQASEAGMIASGECTNCGRCITVCPEDTLAFALRPRIDAPAGGTNHRQVHT
ncbi:MAG: quinol dehydrogenase ferredoxin subunit NapH [Gammaproteobacteria bacterium]|nr:quinol dehydrogenase ferredoxin subunit NapH [Gammaproteobacteria bacterium]